MAAGNGAEEERYASQVMGFRGEMAQIAAGFAALAELVRSHSAQIGQEVARLSGYVQTLDQDVKELKQAVLDIPARRRPRKGKAAKGRKE